MTLCFTEVQNWENGGYVVRYWDRPSAFGGIIKDIVLKLKRHVCFGEDTDNTWDIISTGICSHTGGEIT